MSKLVLGYFGYNNDQIDGQTIKTRNILELFKNEFRDVSYFDTQDLKYNKLALIKLLFDVSVSKEIILVPGKNNLSGLLPFLIKIKHIFSKKVYLFAVGGWLDEYISDENINYFKAIDYLYVESNRLKNNLIQKGLDKITVFPNFRKHNFSRENFLIDKCTIKIIFIARVTPEKGCDFIIDFARFYNKNRKHFKKTLLIDFYGPISKSYEKIFLSNIKDLDFVNYKGYVNPDNVYQTISKYDINILPTHYEGEGFPGTIIDSYISGVPMIVSNWKDLPEFVDQAKTGYVLHDNTIQELYEICKELEDDNNLNMLKMAALNKSKEFSYYSALSIIKNTIF